MRGADRIAIYATGADFGPPSTFKGLVEAYNDRAMWSEGGDQQPEQQAGDRTATPAVPVQHPMIIGEPGVLVQSSDPQGGRDSAAPGSNNGAGDKNEDVMPGRRREALAERLHPGRKLRRRHKVRKTARHPSPPNRHSGETRCWRISRESPDPSHSIQ